jgi:serine/threonine-protein kinase PknK
VDPGGGSFDPQGFAWEARVAQLVSGQPGLPEVLASGLTDNGQPYLVTKLYERGTLLRRVQRGGALSHGEVASVGRQVAMALEMLHRNSILHGDVKPENVFFDDDGSVVLGDLGSAWLRADEGPAAAMTPPYAAPEVWLAHAPSVASDIYSLGLTLMFAAAARVPVAGSTSSEEIIDAFGSDVAQPLLEISPRRRPHSALLAARLFGADEPTPLRAGTSTSALTTAPTERDR